MSEGTTEIPPTPAGEAPPPPPPEAGGDAAAAVASPPAAPPDDMRRQARRVQAGKTAPPARRAPANADEIEAAVQHAQADLATAATSSWMARDPYKLVLAGLSSTLGVLPKVVRRIEGALSGVVTELAELVRAVRHPLTDVEREALKRDILDTTRAGISGAASDVLTLARAKDRRSLALAFVGGLATVVVAAGGAYWFGRASARAEAVALLQAQRAEIALAQERLVLPLPAARAWLRLMQANTDPADALAKAMHAGADKDGRRFAAVPLWLDPQTAPPVPRR